MLSAPASQEPVVHQTRCAFVMHGLNTHPKKMSDLATLAEKLGFTTTVGILSGHQPDEKKTTDNLVSENQWRQEFKEQWSQSVSKCNGPSNERLFIAYSLGAVTGLSVFDQDDSVILPTKMILISPALALRKKTILIRALSWLPFGSLPSVNHPDYRARPNTPLKNYNALFKIHDGWKKFQWKATSQIPTLVVLSPDDELVDSQNIEQSLKQRQQSSWQIHWLSNENSTLRPRYYHLIIDELSQGKQQWDSFTEAAVRFAGGKTEAK
ncbi:MAG: hypothetical protein RLZZ488_1600 [Pseudomonadota bacterium]